VRLVLATTVLLAEELVRQARQIAPSAALALPRQVEHQAARVQQVLDMVVALPKTFLSNGLKLLLMGAAVELAGQATSIQAQVDPVEVEVVLPIPTEHCLVRAE
jgi:hypothetical protein